MIAREHALISIKSIKTWSRLHINIGSRVMEVTCHLDATMTVAGLSSRATEHPVTPWVWIFALNRPCRDRRNESVSQGLQCYARRKQSQHVRDESRKGFLRCDTKKQVFTSGEF